jgi:murein DD-endopeptidase MepM/ murein hydrolase activator NlpD
MNAAARTLSFLFLALAAFLFPAVADPHSVISFGDSLLWPLAIPAKVTSTFGEYRRSHFHAGLDFSTSGVSGYPLRALGPCTVWRVKVDPRGYGKLLGLQMSDGSRVTYAHMKRFAPGVEACVRQMQDQLGHCMVDFYPEPGRVTFEAGDIVGTSGSSGVGPAHLHMEIRTPDGEVVNPLVRWYSVPDSVAPTVYRLVLSPLNSSALINGRAAPVSVRVRKDGESDRWSALTTPQVCGEIGLSVRAVDRINSGGDRVGLYRLRVEIDGEPIFRREYGAFPEDQLRLIELVYDNDLLRRGFGRCERLYKLPGDHLRFHEGSPGDGVLRAGLGGLDYGPHSVDIFLEDAAGNCSAVTLPLLVNYPPEVVGIEWAGPDTLVMDVRDEDPGRCIASFAAKSRGKWRPLESRHLDTQRWIVRWQGPDALLSVHVKDPMGVSSRPFYRGEARAEGDDVAVEASYELEGTYVRITLRSARDLAQAPQTFVCPGSLGFSPASMWAQDERTYGMELLLFPQAAPEFRLVFLVNAADGGVGKAELCVPVSPLAMSGNSLVRSDDGQAWVAAGPDAVFQDTYLRVDGRALPHPGNGLELLTAGYRFSPESALLKGPVMIGMRVPAESATSEGVGIFRWGGGEDYRPLPGTFDAESDAMLGSIDELGTFALLRDQFPPTVRLEHRDGATLARQTIHIKGYAADRGTGVDPASVQMYVDERPVPACPEGAAWVHRLTEPLDAGEHVIRLEARDKVGNSASADVRVRVR